MLFNANLSKLNLALFVYVAGFSTSFYHLNWRFLSPDVNYWCRPSTAFVQRQNNLTSRAWKAMAIPSESEEGYADPLEADVGQAGYILKYSGCRQYETMEFNSNGEPSINMGKVIECQNGWDFGGLGHRASFVTEFVLFCGQTWKVNIGHLLTVATFFISTLFAYFIIGCCPKVKQLQRIETFLAALSVACEFALVASTIFLQFITFRVISTFSFGISSILCLHSLQRTTKVTEEIKSTFLTFCFGWTTHTMLASILVNILRDWRLLQLCLTCLLCTFFFMRVRLSIGLEEKLCKTASSQYISASFKLMVDDDIPMGDVRPTYVKCETLKKPHNIEEKQLITNSLLLLSSFIYHFSWNVQERLWFNSVRLEHYFVRRRGISEMVALLLFSVSHRIRQPASDLLSFFLIVFTSLGFASTYLSTSNKPLWNPSVHFHNLAVASSTFSNLKCWSLYLKQNDLSEISTIGLLRLCYGLASVIPLVFLVDDSMSHVFMFLIFILMAIVEIPMVLQKFRFGQK